MKVYSLREGLFDRMRQLILTPEYIEYDAGNLKGQEFIRLNKADILDFKHEMDWSVFYKFTIGRKFKITFKSKPDKELTISFKSFPASNPYFNNGYSEIIEYIWEYYYNDIVNENLLVYQATGELVFGDVQIRQQGVLLKNLNSMLPWKSVAIRQYTNYFAIYHQDTPQIHTRIDYYKYGSEALWTIIKTILQEKNRLVE